MYDSKYFYPRQFTCPLCSTAFTSLQIKSSTIYVEKRESDFHVIYRGHSPFHYNMVVCPTCEYTKSVNSFNTPIEKEKAAILSDALYKLRSPERFSHQEERDLNTVLECFQMGIRTAQLQQVPPGELAGLILGAAWIARELQNTKLEKNYISQAVEYYAKAYEKSSHSVGNLSDIQVAYLIGELYRKTGKYKEALSWFNRVLSHPQLKNNPQIEQQTRDQWMVAREQAKVEEYEEEAVSGEDIKTSTETENSAPDTTKPQGSHTPVQKKALMQLSSRLYNDQIEWLSRVANAGHDIKTHRLITKEQVLRALMTAAIQTLSGQIPADFTNEEELSSRFYDMFNPENLIDK